MLTGPNVILVLKIAVVLSTGLLIASVLALAMRRPRLHGVLNTLVAFLILVAVVIFEIIIRIVGVDVKKHMDEQAKTALKIHLCFVIPLVPFLIAMLITGWKRRIKVHLIVSVIFSFLWLGMFVTGVFYLPHTDDSKKQTDQQGLIDSGEQK